MLKSHLLIVEHFVNSHAKYINDIVANIETSNITEFNRNLYSSHNTCRIGSWLDEIASTHAELDEYKKIYASHLKFHADIDNIINVYINGEKGRSLDMLKIMQNSSGDAFLCVLETLTKFLSFTDKNTNALF